MALSSNRQNSNIDPSNGIYVEMEGVMEVRYTSEDIDYEQDPEDFFEFQQRVKQIPEDFCHKDKQTTSQACFFCLVCDCDLKSLKSLKDHVTGNKHIRKACEKKRQLYGAPAQIQNAPRIKKIKKEQPRVDVNKTLEERLRDSAQPALGLAYITEYRNPRDRGAHRMYTCYLDGCKSAWGTSDDLYNHVIKQKHLRNYFKKCYPGEKNLDGLTKDQILVKASELEEESGGPDKRDYDDISVVKDYDKYVELRDRPDDWSEKKAKLGMVGKGNSNMEPLGQRSKGRSLGTGSKEGRKRQGSPIFDLEAWRGWRPKSPKSTCIGWIDEMKQGVRDVEDMVENFENGRDSEEYRDIEWFLDHYRSLIKLHESDYRAPVGVGDVAFNNVVRDLKSDLEKAQGDLAEKTEWEEKKMKHVGALLAEVEDEMRRYNSNRDSNKYLNIKARLNNLTKENSSLKPSQKLNKTRKKEFDDRLGLVWEQFENLSDPLSATLERQLGYGEPSSRGEQRQLARETAVNRYKKSMRRFVMEKMEQYSYKNKELSYSQVQIGDEEEFMKLCNYVMEKIVKEEVNSHVKRGESWDRFHLTSSTKNQVIQYTIQKMARYKKGDIF